MRWDPAADRNYALMAENPNTEGTKVDAPLEWLAFRGLPFFPTVPWSSRVLTTAVRGRGDDMEFSWPLWGLGACRDTVRSLTGLRFAENEGSKLLARGVFAVCASEIRRTSQGFGNFGPASVNRVRAG